MLNYDPWINQYNDNDDENDHITEEAYSKYENYLLSVRAEFQRILEQDLLYQYPIFFESIKRLLKWLIGLWLDIGWFYQLKITNSYKFESRITALSDGKTVNKPKGYRFQIGDYLIYNKEKNFYYNLSYAQIKNLYWNVDLICGYVANDEINNNSNNGNKDKVSMIDLTRSD